MEIKTSPEGKKIKVMTLDNLFPPLSQKLVGRLTTATTFFRQITLVHARTLLGTEKISYS